MVQRNEIFFPSTDGKTRLHALVWQSEDEPRAILQIAHGICEYAGRYDDFAAFLAENGFFVVANDHLGHGKSWQEPENEGFFAEKNGWQTAVADLEALRIRIAAEHPGLPCFLLGHSMGSFLARSYLIRYPGKLAGAILSGTGQQAAATVKMGRALCRTLQTLRGSHYRSPFVRQMAFGSYNRNFKPRRTENDWISSDPAVVDAYCADRGTQFLPTVSLYGDMMDGILFMSDPENQKKMDKNTPIFFLSGSMDPVGEEGKGVERAYQSFLAAGCADVRLRLYAGGRHEVLNEVFKAEVWDDVLHWLLEKMPPQA